jgi:hypothetical protein
MVKQLAVRSKTAPQVSVAPPERHGTEAIFEPGGKLEAPLDMTISPQVSGQAPSTATP